MWTCGIAGLASLGLSVGLAVASDAPATKRPDDAPLRSSAKSSLIKEIWQRKPAQKQTEETPESGIIQISGWGPTRPARTNTANANTTEAPGINVLAPACDDDGVINVANESASEDGFLAPVIPPALQDGFRTAQLQPIAVPPSPDSKDTVFRPITQIEPFYDYSPTGTRPHEYLCPQPSDIPDDQRARCPELLPLPPSGTTDRFFAHLNYCWVASDLYHKPLYFEDVSLERYGHSFCEPLQPFVSVGKFGVQLIGLPYQMALDPVCRDQYALGYYRPGDPAPNLLYQPPINFKAAAAAAGVYTGLIFLIP